MSSESGTRQARAGFDAIVVGAGIIGVATALELSRSGRAVLVLDAGPEPGAGSTGASSAIVRLHYSRRDSVVAALDCYHDWLSWSEYLGYEDPGPTMSFIPTGALVLDGVGVARQSFLGHLSAVGVPYEEMAAAEITERFPAIDARAFGPPATPESEDFWRPAGGPLGGFFYESAGYVDDPQLAARNISAAARHHGARFRFREMVSGVRQRHDRVTGVVLASGETITAPVVVNVAGPASDALNQMAAVTADMSVRPRPLRTETHEVPAPPGFAAAAGGAFVTDLDLGVAFRPQGHGLLHISSVEPECDHLEWIDDPWHFNPLVTEAAYTRQTLRAARRLPSLRVPHQPKGIGALYDVTPDWTPIFDRSALDGFYLACGTSGNSFKLAPMAGRAMLAIIEASEGGRDIDAQPLRLRATHLDAQIDLAPFSRRRTVSLDGPKNVIA